MLQRPAPQEVASGAVDAFDVQGRHDPPGKHAGLDTFWLTKLIFGGFLSNQKGWRSITPSKPL